MKFFTYLRVDLNRQTVDLVYSGPTCGDLVVAGLRAGDRWGVGVMAGAVGNLDLFSGYSDPMITLERRTVVLLLLGMSFH